MDALDRIQLEKAGADRGFDITPVLQGEWLLLRSSQFDEPMWVSRNVGQGSYRLAVAGKRLCAELSRDGVEASHLDDMPSEATGCFSLQSYRELHGTLGRASALAQSLPTRLAERFATETKSLPKSTEAERLVVQRVGQELFRQALIEYWQGRCAVTGLDLIDLLRASHIKPWSDCESDNERLDVFNGLLLAPQLDALFDGGWVTFDDLGSMRISDSLGPEAQSKLALVSSANLRWLADEHKAYLAFHRARVFRAP